MASRSCCSTTLWLAAAACVVAAGGARGQDAPRALVDAKGLRCTFPVAAAAVWKDAAPQIAIGAAGLSIGFTSIEAEDGMADPEGGAGVASTSVTVTSGTLHFLQTLRSGALYSTTVFNRQLRPGVFKAVHTRHESTVAGGPRAEQFYGECRIVQAIH
jgi:hypothetical protein